MQGNSGHGVENADLRLGRPGNAGKAARLRAGAGFLPKSMRVSIRATPPPRPAAVRNAACPYCQVHCPVQNNIPDWLKLAAEGRLEEAYEVSASTNNFPEICGAHLPPRTGFAKANCVIEQAGPRHRHHRGHRALHHRHGLGESLGHSRSSPAPS